MNDSTKNKLTQVQLEVINKCNYTCPLCKTMEKDWVPRTRIELDQVKAIIDPVASQIEDIALFGTRGEPLLHKELEKIVKYLKRVTTAKVTISTNGSLLTPKRGEKLLDAGLDQVVFAVDGISQESYSAYRQGGKLSQVLDNIRSFCALKKAGNYDTRIIFQFIPMAGNEHELPLFPTIAYNLGVDLVKAKFSSSVARSSTFKTKNKIFQELVSTDDEFRCPFEIDKIYIDPNGFGYPCCYAEGIKKYCIGNVVDGIADVWDSEQMQAFKKPFIDQKNFHEFCMTKCHKVPRKKKLLIRKRELENQKWLENIKELLSPDKLITG